MTPAEIVSIRNSLNMTQGQLALLLGVHSLTVSKWEREVVVGGVRTGRGLLQPTPHQEALLRAAGAAAQRTPDVGSVVVGALMGAGVGIALFHLLRAAFETPTQTPNTPRKKAASRTRR